MQQIDDHVRLSPNEAEVVKLVCQGRSTSGISQALRIAESTVKSYLDTLYKGLKFSSRAELMVWGLQNPDALFYRTPAPRNLHETGCPCAGGYCQTMKPREIMPALPDRLSMTLPDMVDMVKAL